MGFLRVGLRSLRETGELPLWATYRLADVHHSAEQERKPVRLLREFQQPYGVGRYHPSYYEQIRKGTWQLTKNELRSTSWLRVSGHSEARGTRRIRDLLQRI